MRRFASSLTILTTEHRGSRAGILATACSSVSAIPPSIVVGVNRNSTAWSAITQRGMFACNLLGDRHGFLIQPFSTSKTPAAQRFAFGNWKTSDGHSLFDRCLRCPFLRRRSGFCVWNPHALCRNCKRGTFPCGRPALTLAQGGDRDDATCCAS